MNASTSVPDHSVGLLPAANTSARQTPDFAATLFAEVKEAYLTFRQQYYYEEYPSLTTPPPVHADIRQSELAVLAENTLRLVPKSVQSLPLVGGLLEHLEEVANIHTISETERTALHNMTVTFLYGIQGGIQPWYLTWLSVTAHNLARITDPHYFMRFPWDACVYLEADELSVFDTAVRRGNTKEIQRCLRQIADRLIEALHDPVEAEAKFAFSGPIGERQKAYFHLRTAAAIALGAYLVTTEARSLLTKQAGRGESHSVQAPLPEEIAAHRVAN
jgi:hypothetical protein